MMLTALALMVFPLVQVRQPQSRAVRRSTIDSWRTRWKEYARSRASFINALLSQVERVEAVRQKHHEGSV